MRRPGSVAFLLVFLISAIAHGQGCSTTAPTNNVVNLTARQTTTDMSTFVNPMAGKAVVKDSAKVSWLTEPQFLSGTAASSVATGHFPLTIGYCTTDAGGKADVKFPIVGIDPQQLAATPALALQFAPTEASNGEPFVRYLKLEWSESAALPAGKPPAATDTPHSVAYKVVAIAGVPDFASDSRYKLWIYTGYTYLRSKDDFKSGYPEMLLRTETRWQDQRIYMKHYKPVEYAKIVDTGCMVDTRDSNGNCPKWKYPAFQILRLYGDMGLTGTTVVANSAGGSTLGDIKQTFAANVGVGYGKTVLVSTLKPTDTSAFSAMFVARLGMITIPGSTDAATGTVTDGRGAFNYSANLRIENEPSFRDDGIRGGNFEGAYFEIGIGESEQFSRKKFPRLRADGLLPIAGGSDLFRFATRLQIDAPRPLARQKDGGDNLANEIRLSIVFNIDLLELGKRISKK
ncbi:MAG: hypothetical protein QOI24_2842 [Acidobacteriota bacterium]|jgi:hypothetical protein|nr:hypothetical protein [Acidobacteriota bacterium]